MKDQELLNLLDKKFDYCPLSGDFFRKSGRKAGGYNKFGYRVISINHKKYKAHRLSFFIHHKRWPNGFLDHINGRKHDNRPCNLREVTNSQNQINKNIQVNNLSGYKGVGWNKHANKWRVTMKADNKNMYFGYFKCRHNAARVWNTAARMYQGYQFCYTNKIEKCECDECRI